MRLLVFDVDGGGWGVDLALRAKAAGHKVRYWITTHPTGERLPYGEGLLERPDEWEPSMEWAELIVLTGNSKYSDRLANYFGKGYPIFGTNAKSAELETNREVGQQVLQENGIETLPYHVADNLDEAIERVSREGKAVCIKPWGYDADKAMTCVARDATEAIFLLERWKEKGLKGQLMLQEKAEGVEVGISAFFGPGGWSAPLEESFEHKRFLNDDLGQNTGEMGTVIRHVEKSKLFDILLRPLTDYLHFCKYVGDCSINCIVDRYGTPWPLEFTCRLGWPDFCIRQAVIKGDPVEWMADLLYGRDSLEVSSEIAVGVSMAHGDFPKESGGDPLNTWAGFPIDGADNDSVSLLQVKWGQTPTLRNGNIQHINKILTAGTYVLVGSGSGRTVSRAAKAAYEVVDNIRWPSNIMYRTDIGDRLEADLPKLQKHGYARGMEF